MTEWWMKRSEKRPERARWRRRYERRSPSSLRRRRQAAMSIVARFSTRPSAHETSFTLSLSLPPPPSPTFPVFLDLCSQYFSTDRKWESHLLQQHSRPVAVQPFSAVAPATSIKEERREKRTMEGGTGRNMAVVVCN